MHRLILTLGGLAAAVMLAVSPTLAGKPGGGAPPDYSVSFVSGSAGGTLGLMNADGSATKKFNNISVAHHSWHADGDKLLVSAAISGPEGIYTVDMNGSSSLVLAVDLGPGAWPSMSRVPAPTGSRLIAYVGYDSAGSDTLYVCNEDGSNPVALLTASPYVYLNGPTFHPSGSAIALTRKDTLATLNGWKVVLVELGFDGSGNAIATNVTQLTGLPGTPLEYGDTLGPAFSNSGDILAVAHNVDDIWFIDMDTFATTNVTNGRVPLVTMGGWDATDQTFYFAGRSGRYTTIHTIDAGGNMRDLGVRGYKPRCRMR